MSANAYIDARPRKGDPDPHAKHGGDGAPLHTNFAGVPRAATHRPHCARMYAPLVPPPTLASCSFIEEVGGTQAELLIEGLAKSTENYRILTRTCNNTTATPLGRWVASRALVRGILSEGQGAARARVTSVTRAHSRLRCTRDAPFPPPSPRHPAPPRLPHPALAAGRRWMAR
jgi:hypothetical protein